MYLVYSLLFTLGAILTAPYYLWRLRGRILSAADWRERLGLLPPDFPIADQNGALWVHAVSVGETLAAVGLVERLQREFPERKVYLSSVTVAGREVGEKRFPDIAGHFYLPLDWRTSVRRVIRRLRPALLLIVETELWPNLMRVARESGTRVVLVNARLSNRSFRGYRVAKPFMRRVLECVDWVAAQTPQDAERFVRLGAPPERVAMVGNLKFDGKPPQVNQFTCHLRAALDDVGRRPVLVAASTMSGEEQILLQSWKQIRGQHPQALLILAPRHASRFGEVRALLSQSRLNFVRRTALAAESPEMAKELQAAEILLLDTIGELAGIFELADVVFVGGSLVPTGGHNLLEPAYWGKPIVFGPHMENFRDIAQQFTAAGAAMQVQSARELAPAVLTLLRNQDQRIRMGDQARQLMEQGAGATERTLEQLRLLLGARAAMHIRA